MKELLKFIHFKMFENVNEEKKLRSQTDFIKGDEIRNDERISNCMKTSKLLDELEQEVLKRI